MHRLGLNHRDIRLLCRRTYFITASYMDRHKILHVYFRACPPGSERQPGRGWAHTRQIRVPHSSAPASSLLYAPKRLCQEKIQKRICQAGYAMLDLQNCHKGVPALVVRWILLLGRRSCPIFCWRGAPTPLWSDAHRSQYIVRVAVRWRRLRNSVSYKLRPEPKKLPSAVVPSRQTQKATWWR